jgi:hypothetical protein
VRRGWTRTLVVATALAAVTSLGVVPALGHASGILPHARLAAEGHVVFVQWTAAPDDVADIGVGLGLLEEDHVLAYQGAGDRFPSAAQLERFATSDELADYLVEHVRIRQGGRECPGEVSVGDDLFADGFLYEFRCPAPVEVVDVRITMLHDRDELYRTYSIDGTYQDAMHSVHHPEHAWDFTVTADGPDVVTAGALRSNAALLAGAALVPVLAVLAVRRWLWRPSDRR